jgi:uncharacterized membrane protein YphA (DoxX/SURF4 family)
VIASRWLLGVVFIYMGAMKALHPVDFLKIVHQYDLVRNALLLNLIAAVLPWLEVFCGILLVSGLMIRPVSIVLLAMLIPFTAAVVHRAIVMQHAGSIPFCAIRFDCGCGGGEVNVCRKICENFCLISIALLLAILPPIMNGGRNKNSD